MIVIALSEPLDPDTVTAARVLLQGPGGAVAATAVFDGTSQRIVLTPRAALAGESDHTVSILPGITDVAGNPLAPTSWSFTTAVAPEPTPTQIFHSGFEDGEVP